MDQDFYADSSAALGLSHAAQRAESIEERDDRHLLSDPRWNERENRRLQKQCEAEGMPYGLLDAVAAADAREPYEHIDRRVRELVGSGFTIVDATAIARDEEAVSTTPEIPSQREDRSYLGASLDDLMDVHRPVKHGSKRSGKLNRSKGSLTPDQEALYNRMLGAP